ncbi:MAG: AzlD domain-containing protein [Peptoniphilaceae bacterium]|nr:AzlD domain-containing protein [Peptoniphilaceae bacterium]MDD7383728.1 AzlD domain-containing protein [Peptoniphilaceae bacterium]MDY3737873.1 AzlD domain-containing protein [Peptoniphilaceae bacterium]
MIHDFLLIFVIAFFTFITRAIPFLFLKNKKSKVIDYLGEVLPFSVMAMLVVFCLKDINFSNKSHFFPEIIAVIVTVLSYKLKRNTLFSVFLGTIVYMICVQFIFI